MNDVAGPPTGLARRGRRLPDAETERRMLQAALNGVKRTGLTVSLDSISMEDVIREADVSRSSVYRRWPYKDLFISDLVKVLAEAAVPSATDQEAIVRLVKAVAAEHDSWLETAEGRRGLLVELLRQAAAADFETLYRSPEWRTYLALHATFMSLPAGPLRDEVQETLARSQRGFIARVARAWEHLASLFGYRLRPELGAGYELLATLVGAISRGLILMSLSMPELVSERLNASPFGASGVEEWSVVATGMAAIAFAFFEPDPAVKWGPERVAMVRQALATLSGPQWILPRHDGHA
ncbi:MAG: TetR/AcrR family transcriptional regulator [Actinomycetota bacterium]|jgi:AcrR family transcriptional regulator|nr:TetR/AcrR family transcriptional regulator [Actinomycetota bacterium]